MSTEADFEKPVVAEHTVEVRFRLTGDRFKFRRIGQFLSPDAPHIDHDPLRSVQGSSGFPQWELNWLARTLAESALSNML